MSDYIFYLWMIPMFYGTSLMDLFPGKEGGLNELSRAWGSIPETSVVSWLTMLILWLYVFMYNNRLQTCIILGLLVFWIPFLSKVKFKKLFGLLTFVSLLINIAIQITFSFLALTLWNQSRSWFFNSLFFIGVVHIYWLLTTFTNNLLLKFKDNGVSLPLDDEEEWLQKMDVTTTTTTTTTNTTTTTKSN